ncbi:cell division protein [Eikenella sp. S3360]|uniref:Cell division protein n=1 Tax=Eikenella glucosivorans TaxID=2766967 RepID=A0ABS0N7B6_9NEIS|nr:cell division protein [Eikenella glucosivorans]MBH5328197.1 cell division protein [Eikenella glucosivorans]
MKWLFAILVALNIIVFGGMLVTRMAQPQPAPVVQPQQQPTTVVVHAAPAQNTAPQQAQQGVPVLPADAARPRQSAAPARGNAPAQGKPAEGQPKPTPESGIRAPSTACTATALLPEDDYHRIKGLLARWPHAATRVVERRRDGGRAQRGGERYQVSVAIEGDVQEFTAKLRSQGFRSASVSGGRMSLGSFANERQAEQTAVKARQAGLNPQIARTGAGGGEQSAELGESKMQVTFMNVDDNAAAGISSVIGRYSSLRRAPCRR